ncbi:hypothetical protein C7U61_08110 [Rhizobium sp. JAB6]|nr:hypothetical protein C7U61_08110 [Rhizobium sp. JAB6]
MPQSLYQVPNAPHIGFDVDFEVPITGTRFDLMAASMMPGRRIDKTLSRVLIIRRIHQYYGILGFSLAIVTDKTYNAY